MGDESRLRSGGSALDAVNIWVTVEVEEYFGGDMTDA